MAIVSFDLGTDTQRVITALCAVNGYQATLPDGTANPQTPAQFAKACVVAYIRQTVFGYEQSQAGSTIQPPTVT